jgi:hypothetical protein
MSLHPDSKRMNIHDIDAFAVICQDPRFTIRVDSADDGDRKAARKALGTERVEFIQFGGGAEAMGCACDVMQSKQAIISALMVAIKSHHAKRGLLVTHTECGAISLSGQKFDSLQAEKEFHFNHLRDRRKEVMAAYPELEELLTGYMTIDENDNVVIEIVN